jgi:hypothetical protein
MYTELQKYSESHHWLGNYHTGAPELKGRTDVASQFVSDCHNLFHRVLFPSFQSDEMQTVICYLPSLPTSRMLCLSHGWLSFSVCENLSDCEALSSSLFSLYVNLALVDRVKPLFKASLENSGIEH